MAKFLSKDGKFYMRNGKLLQYLPTLAAENTWYKSSQDKATITKIALKDSYTPETTVDESWDASAMNDGSIMAYRTGTEIILAGNGSGNIAANKSSKNAFREFTLVESITGLDILNTSHMVVASSMFTNCSSLTTLDLSTWDMSNCTTIGSMFYGCSNLVSVGDLSNWNTSNITRMPGVFYKCSKLTTTGNLNNWDTSKVNSLQSMFSYCESLVNIGDLSNWDTSNVTHMGGMFYICSNLTSVGDLSNWNTSNVTNFQSMFAQCSKLENIGTLSNWVTSNATNIGWMFTRCNALTGLDVSSWNVSNVTEMTAVFNACHNLNNQDVSKWSTSKAVHMNYLFAGCYKMTKIDVSNFDTSNVTQTAYMFANCYALTDLNVAGLNTSKSEYMHWMFSGCKVLTNLDISSVSTLQIEDEANMEYFFNGDRSLQSVTLGKDFKFVGTKSYLPTPASGKWYDTTTGIGYTPAELAAVVRTVPVTYSATAPAPVSKSWVINETPDLTNDMSVKINFTSFNGISSYKHFAINSSALNYDNSIVCDQMGFIKEAYRTVVFETAPTGELLTWLQANAVPQ